MPISLIRYEKFVIELNTSLQMQGILAKLHNPETPVEPANGKSSQGIIINDAKTISEETFNNIE